jgi:hypothetical protein
MKKMKLLFVLAAICTLVGVAAADFNIIDRNTFKANTVNGARVNNTGDARVEVTNPDYRQTLFVPSFLSCILTGRTAGGALPPSPAVVRDSTAAYDVRGYNGLGLMFYPTFDDSLAAVAVALQVRWHPYPVVDSASTFVEQTQRIMTGATTSSTDRDSIGSFVLRNTNLFTSSMPDTLSAGDERVIVFTSAGSSQRGVFVRLTPSASTNFSAGPYLSIRVRHLNGYNASLVPYGVNEPQFRLTAALVGWR